MYFRAECELADKQNKKLVFVRTEEYKPTKWLAAIVGQEMYYNCFDIYEVDECAKKLARELNDCGKKSSSGRRSKTDAPTGTAAGNDSGEGGEEECCTVS